MNIFDLIEETIGRFGADTFNRRDYISKGSETSEMSFNFIDQLAENQADARIGTEGGQKTRLTGVAVGCGRSLYDCWALALAAAWGRWA